MPGANEILNASNTFIAVSNLAGYSGTNPDGTTRTIRSLPWIPLGTVGDSATGEIAVKVKVIESVIPAGSGATFTSSPALVTASGSIPTGVLGWSFTAVSGTVTLNGSGILPLGASFRGGGYAGYEMDGAIPYTITTGSALVSYDTPV